MKDLLNPYLHTSIVINAFDELISVDDMDNETIIASNAKRLIENYFENRKIHVNAPDGNPEEMTFIRVSGSDYIRHIFYNDYDIALAYIIEMI